MTNLSPETRNAVITRDKGLCVNCGNKGTEVHHIYRKSKLNIKLYGSDKIHSPENLLTVCHSCHEKYSTWHKPYKDKIKWVSNSKIK